MIQNLYSVRDLIAELYSMPFMAATDTAATRMIHTAVMKGDGAIAQFPEHFNLFKIGSFNDSTGELAGQVPDLVAQGSNLANQIKASHPQQQEGATVIPFGVPDNETNTDGAA